MNAALLAAAGRIDDAAEMLRARAGLIGLHATTITWRSPAAPRYLRRLEDVTLGLNRCANRLTELANLVRREALREHPK